MTPVALVGAPTAIAVESPVPGDEALLDGLGLRVARDVDELRGRPAPTVAVLSRPDAPIVGCYGWYVGPGQAPDWRHAVPGGAAATRRLQGLLGTSFAQERAGARFRAASRSRSAPESTPFDLQAVLDGITSACRARTSSPTSLRSLPDTGKLLVRPVQVLDGCCGANGAIAAAPRASGGPD